MYSTKKWNSRSKAVTLNTIALATIVCFICSLLLPSWATFSSLSQRATASPIAERTEITSGAVNLFDVAVTKDGIASLMLKTNADGVQYHPDEVLLRATTANPVSVPELPGVSGYLISDNAHTQNSANLELGWELSRLQNTDYREAFVRIDTKAPAGAKVYAFTKDSQGSAQSVIESGEFAFQSRTRIEITDLQHVPVNWVFTQEGTYELTASVIVRDSVGTYSTRAEGVYLIHVGSAEPSTDGLVALGSETTAGESEETTEETEEFTDPAEENTDSGSANTGGHGTSPESADPNAPFGDTPQLVAPEEHPKDPVTGKEMLYRTHVDAAHVYWDRETQQLKIGVIDGATLRPADLVAVRVGPDADLDGNEVSRIKVPAGAKFSFLGEEGDILWNAPAQFYQGWRPVWAGYGAGYMPKSMDQDSLQLELVGVEGPGEMIVWRSGGDFVAEDFHSAKADKTTKALVPGGHGHINWSFTKPGRYLTKWRANATTTAGAPLTSDVYEVLWLVGPDEMVGLPEGTTPSATIATPADAATAPAIPGVPTNTEEEEIEPEATAPAKGKYVCADPGHFDYEASISNTGKVEVLLRDDTVTPAKKHPTYTVVVPVPDAAASVLDPTGNKAPLGALGAKGRKIWTLPEVQHPQLAWLGFNTQHIDYRNIGAQGVRVSLSNHEGPGRIIAWDGGAISPAKILLDTQNYDLRLPFREATHRHVAFSFNQPGLYQVSLAFTPDFTAASGFKANYKFYDTYFAVGDESVESLCPGYLVKHKLSNTTTGTGEDNTGVGENSDNTGTGQTGAGDSTGNANDTAGNTEDVFTFADNKVATDANPKQCLPAGVDTVFDAGHVDMFAVHTVNGKPQLGLKEDITGQGVIRDPETVVLRVKETALMDIPAQQRPAGVSAKAYVLPQVQDTQRNLLWAGWDTLGARAAGYTKTKFNVSYSAPADGKISLWMTSAFSGIESRLADGGFVLDPAGAQILQDYPAHTHVNWGFSKAGRYILKVSAHLSDDTGAKQETTATRTYIFDVGAVDCPEAKVTVADFADTKAENTADADASTSNAGSVTTVPVTDEVCIPTTITREATAQEAQALKEAESKSTARANTASTVLTFQVGSGGNVVDGHFDIGPGITGNKVVALVKDDRKQPATWVNPTTLSFGLGEKAKLKAPKELSFVASPGSDIWMIPATQIAGVPWVGMNSQRPEIVNGTRGGVTFTLDSVSGPGKVAVFAAGALGSGVGTKVFNGAGSSYVLPANTHAHFNWVFTKPGTYKLAISMKVNPSSGQLVGSQVSDSQNGIASRLTPTGETGPNGLPMVSEVVGRTASGAPCELAYTGSSLAILNVIAVMCLLGGVVMCASRKRSFNEKRVG